MWCAVDEYITPKRCRNKAHLHQEPNLSTAAPDTYPPTHAPAAAPDIYPPTHLLLLSGSPHGELVEDPLGPRVNITAVGPVGSTHELQCRQ